jgi:MFS family permease
MDLGGTTLVLGALICFILALQWGGVTKPWSSPDVIGTLVGFGLLSSLFVVLQWYLGERAMIVGHLLKNRTISVGMLYIFFLGGGFFTLLYYVPLYFQVVSGVDASQSGIRNLPLILGVVISTIASGGIITATGHYVPMYILSGILGTVGAGLIYTLDIGSSSGAWIGYQAIAGLGIGLGLQVPVITAQAVSKPHELSSATAMVLCKYLASPPHILQAT